jgi:hypothetical protein
VYSRLNLIVFMVSVALRTHLITLCHEVCPCRQPAAFRWGKVKRQAGGGPTAFGTGERPSLHQ